VGTFETRGIHHVTAICGDPQRNVDFYAGVLGLRLVKRTVNFDDPQAYHLYFGDGVGHPGSLITFFPWPDAPRGRVGPGQIAVTSLGVAPSALGFWIQRLLRHGVAYRGPTTRQIGDIKEQVLSFSDGDGLMLELVATPAIADGAGWDGAPEIPSESAIRGIRGVTLWEAGGAATGAILTDLLGLESAGIDDTTHVFAAGARQTGSFAAVRTIGGFPEGNISVGTVHHVAWRVPDDATQLSMREHLVSAGLDPTPVIDRKYFRSVYFFEPGGVLFELATEAPGFAIDEPVEHLGEQLMLPSGLESLRAELENALPPIHLPDFAGPVEKP
jgi:glyoxalase family protein